MTMIIVLLIKFIYMRWIQMQQKKKKYPTKKRGKNNFENLKN